MIFLSDLSQQIYRAWAYVTTGRTLAIIFGVGFALLAIFLLIASRTKWGQAKPLTKCVLLSVLAHVWLLMYALGSRSVLPQGNPNGHEQSMSVAFEADSTPFPSVAPEPISEPEETRELQDWEKPVPLADLPKPADLESLFAGAEMTAPELLPTLEPTPMPALPPLQEIVDNSEQEAASEQGDSFDSSSQLAGEPVVEQPVFPSVLPPELSPSQQPLVNQTATPASVVPPSTTPIMRSVASSNSPILPPDMQLPVNPNLPKEYQLRQAPNRLQLATAYGADADSEAAVSAGLNWLSAAQSTDGSWVAKQFGAGTETNTLGEYRHGTGDRADTGISGLALLAYLSAGHTHLDGKHKQVVQLGLQYLLRAQMPSGDLSGPKQVGTDPSVMNARMYCHSIATLAIAEAYAMTHDVALKDALMRAAQYSINAQDVRGGGWRYKPGDPGDLSQFGWQAMALKSVQRSGIEIPVEVSRRMRRFLDSCTTGTYGGLARYRPQEGRPSETMTAEALACRLLLDYPMTLEAQREGIQMIMASRPGIADDNVYFWYYATLALFQLQDENWRVWNQSMKSRLISSQLPAYAEQPGSWDPDPMWGGYGGRVYSTAMSCLCLEVYYRYLPLYQRSNLARQPQPQLSR